MDASALHPLHQLSNGELEGAIDALLEKAARCSPPRNIVESEQQAGALRRLARVRDEMHRRARARAGLAPAAGGHLSTKGMRAGARRAATARAVARAPSEDQVDLAIARLEALHERARDNLVRQGRDPSRARVALTWWQEAVGLRGARWRALVATLERRGLVQFDGAFVASTAWRAAA